MHLRSPLSAFWVFPTPQASDGGMWTLEGSGGGKEEGSEQTESLSYFEQLNPICPSADLKAKPPPGLWAWGPQVLGPQREDGPLDLVHRGRQRQCCPGARSFLPSPRKNWAQRSVERPRLPALLPPQGYGQVPGTEPGDAGSFCPSFRRLSSSVLACGTTLAV